VTFSAETPDTATLRNGWVACGWAVVAFVAHTVFALAVVPLLPSSVLIWFAGDFASVGDHYYSVETSWLVSAGYWATGIILAAAVVGMIAERRGAAWAFFIPLVVCAVTPCLMFFVYASVAWQIGREAPATTMSDAAGFVIMLLGAAGVAVGLISILRPGSRKAGRAVRPAA